MNEHITGEVIKSLKDLLPDDVPTLEEQPTAIEPRPSIKQPWDPHYNPVTDAVAVVRFGATWVRPGRYLSPDGLMLDENGAMCDPEECPGCGSTPGNDVSRFVKIRPANPNAPPWEWDFTYCRVCTPVHLRASLPERRRGGLNRTR